MNRDIWVYLQDILESIGIIEEYTQEFSAEDFFHRRQTQDAVIRRLEIIGEAVKHIPSDIRIEGPAIPWEDISDSRQIRLSFPYRFFILEYAAKVKLSWILF